MNVVITAPRDVARSDALHCRSVSDRIEEPIVRMALMGGEGTDVWIIAGMNALYENRTSTIRNNLAATPKRSGYISRSDDGHFFEFKENSRTPLNEFLK